MANEMTKPRVLGVRLDLVISLLILVITFGTYWEIKHHDFVSFDDGLYVEGNHYVRDGFTREGVLWAFTIGDATYQTYWHPLTWLSHMLDSELYGLAPGMHHRTSLIIHIANVILLFLLLNRMTRATWRSAFVAILFAVHPINVDSVAWIAERKNLLSTFFAFLTMHAYATYARRETILRYSLCLFLFALGLLSKPTVAVVPFLLLLLDYWPLARFKIAMMPDKQPLSDLHQTDSTRTKKRLTLLFLEKLPFLAFSCIAIYIASSSLQQIGSGIPTSDVPLKLRLANAVVSYVQYMGKMIWPHNFSVYYPFPSSVAAWQTAMAIAFLVAVSAVAVLAAKRYPYMLAGWLWYLGALLPVSGIMQAGLWPAMADRWAYVPLVGIFIIISWGVPDILYRFSHRKVLLAGVALATITTLCLCTWRQVRVWTDTISLFTHALQINPNNFVAHNNLGLAYKEMGRDSEAMWHYKKALEISPYYPLAHNNIGNIYLEKNDEKTALLHYKNALALDPHYAEAYNNIGAIFLKNDNLAEAEKYFLKALELNSHDPRFHFNMALLSSTRGDFEKAKMHYSEVLRYRPEDAVAHNNLGDALFHMGDTHAAVLHFQAAVRLNPDNALSKANLGKARGELLRRGQDTTRKD